MDWPLLRYSLSPLHISYMGRKQQQLNTDYSKTSDSGPSEIGTQYNKPLNKGLFSRSQIIGLSIVLIHFEPPRRGQPLYKGQNTLIYIGPKVSFVRRFGCISHLINISNKIVSWYTKLLHATNQPFLETPPNIVRLKSVSIIIQ